MNLLLPALLCIDQVAKRLARPRQEVYRLIREGHLPAHRLSERLYRVSEADLVAFLEGNVSTETEKNTKLVAAENVAALSGGDLSSPPVDEGSVGVSYPPIPPELDPERAAALVPSVPPAGVFTVAYLMGEWLNDTRGRVRPKTYLSYEQMARLHIVPVLGMWKVERLDIRTVERFLQYKYQSGLSARSVQYLRALMRQAYNEAIRWGWLSRNIPALARGPKAERSQITVPSPEEARRLLVSLRNLRYGPIYITALGLGLRLGEVLGLRWCDVCLPDPRDEGELGQITVRVQLQRIGSECQLLPPKSYTSIRALSLPPFVADALAIRRDEQRAERAEAGGKWRNKWGLVFTNRLGNPLDESRVRQRFREHLRNHGFAHMRFHDLRHLCASLLLSEGTHPRVLMEILGHSSIALTMDTYCHVMKSAHPKAARSMEKALGIMPEGES